MANRGEHARFFPQPDSEAFFRHPAIGPCVFQLIGRPGTPDEVLEKMKSVATKPSKKLSMSGAQPAAKGQGPAPVPWGKGHHRTNGKRSSPNLPWGLDGISRPIGKSPGRTKRRNPVCNGRTLEVYRINPMIVRFHRATTTGQTSESARKRRLTP